MNIKNLKFQIFGSESSQDIDVMFFVDEIKSTQDSHDLCYELDVYLSELLNTDKEINSNLAILNNGVITKVFKGTIEECNNSLYLTYNLHSDIQLHNNMIEHLLKRNVQLKILRTCRVLLSFWSRSEYRTSIKKALRGNVYDKINMLKLIDINTIGYNGKNIKYEDYVKVIAFQLGQTIALIDDVELYTKESVYERYPDLKNHLMRKNDADLKILNRFLNIFISKIEHIIFKEVYEKLPK